MECGLSTPSLGWIKSLDQGISAEMYEAQRRENDPSVRLKVAKKMSKLVSRGYIIEGVIPALKYLFYVPKGTYDIRIVFDATVSGLNDYLWDPNFVLPPMGSLLMMVGPKTYMVDLDVGEIFYYF